MNFEFTDRDLRRAPAEAGEKHLGANAEGVAEANERVRPGNPFAALKLRDRRAVQASSEAKLFLADSELLAAAGYRFAPKTRANASSRFLGPLMSVLRDRLHRWR